MSYIGRGVDAISNVEKLDNITFNGGTTYALTKSSAAFTPVGANNILVSIDGVIQQGNFSVSTTNIVFDWSPTSSNTCNFILHYGTGVLNVPADGSVSLAKMAANSIDSDQYVDGSIDAVHLSANSVDSDAYVDASIDNAHLADDAVGIAELSATGTASSSTFLRGDNSWAAAGGGKIRQVKTLVSTNTFTSTAQSWTDVGIEVAFDSNFADGNSKVLCFFSLSGTQNTDIGNSWAMFNYFTIYEGSTNRGNADRGLIGGNSLTDASSGAGAPGYHNYHMSGSVLFTPSTTTTPTCTIYGRGPDPTYTWTWSVGRSAQYSSTNYYSPTTITIMEVTN